VFSINGGRRPSNNLTLIAGVDNLFNKTYAEHVKAVPPALAALRHHPRERAGPHVMDEACFPYVT
jgi:outer membrane receptor for ferrienterochelin and colicin